VPEEEELRRVIPLIRQLCAKVEVPLSIDTMKWRIAAAAVEAGATFINDVTGFSDPRMCEVAASASVDVCVMHMQGSPKTMQQAPHYSEGITQYLLRWFEDRIATLLHYGIAPARIYLDPGIGFGKTVAHNLEIIQNLPQLKSLGFPLLLGLSRKSFMGKVTSRLKSYDELLPETLAMNTLACVAQVEILRVHDVVEHRAVIDLMDAYLSVTSH
jgi:dihydropteroate synthase